MQEDYEAVLEFNYELTKEEIQAERRKIKEEKAKKKERKAAKAAKLKASSDSWFEIKMEEILSIRIQVSKLFRVYKIYTRDITRKIRHYNFLQSGISTFCWIKITKKAKIIFYTITNSC